MSEIPGQKKCAPAGVRYFLFADEVACNAEDEKVIPERNWRVSVSGGAGFTTEHLKVEGPGGLGQNERRDANSSQGFGTAILTLARHISLTHHHNNVGGYCENIYIAPRLDLSFSRLHAASHPDDGSDQAEINVATNRYMALAGVSVGFDLTDAGRLSGLNLFAEMGPEVIPTYTAVDEGGDRREEPSVISWSTFRSGLEMIFPVIKSADSDASLWAVGIEMGGIRALNPVARSRQWGLEALLGLHSRF